MAIAGEIDVHARAAVGAGGVEEQRVVDTLHVAVHQRQHRLLLGCGLRHLFLGVRLALRVLHVLNLGFAFRVVNLLPSALVTVGGTEIHERSDVVSCNGDGLHLADILLLEGRRRRECFHVGGLCAVLGGVTVVAAAAVLLRLHDVVAGTVGATFLGVLLLDCALRFRLRMWHRSRRRRPCRGHPGGRGWWRGGSLDHLGRLGRRRRPGRRRRHRPWRLWALWCWRGHWLW